VGASMPSPPPALASEYVTGQASRGGG
jgi:hypothetical protein